MEFTKNWKILVLVSIILKYRSTFRFDDAVIYKTSFILFKTPYKITWNAILCTQVLDSVTLANLDILVNQSTGTAEGSLIERLDYCKTGGGKRLLREWLSAPLCDHNLINVSIGGFLSWIEK